MMVDIPEDCADNYREAAALALRRYLDIREGDPPREPLDLSGDIVVARVDHKGIRGVSLMRAEHDPAPRGNEGERDDAQLRVGFRTVERWYRDTQCTPLVDMEDVGRHVLVVDVHPSGEPAQVEWMHGGEWRPQGG